MDLDVRVLRYFLAVAKEGSLKRAAESLHITQPTLSRQILELEHELGVSLVVHGRKPVMLTESGILFQQRAKELVELADKTRREMAERSSMIGGTVSIACVESIVSRLLPDVMQKFSKQFPHVKYELYSADGDDIREKIDRGRVDLGILLEPVETSKYDFIRLPFYDTWGVAVRNDSHLASKKSLTTMDIANIPLIIPRRTIVIEEISRWLAMKEEELIIVASHNLPTNGLLLVKKGIGNLICVKGSFTIRPAEGICFIPFSPKRITGHVLAWKKDHAFSPSTHRFLSFIQDVYKCNTTVR
ncbi:MAG: LysR family transcriptional regulator [Desulfovibrio sp.]|nr:LysR family transcriptional regulator [Desulfovibrio sp.]